MGDYWYAPGLVYPYWWVTTHQDYPEPGTDTVVAGNGASDFGDNLFDDEFFDYFPRAMPITEQQYKEKSVTLDEWRNWYKGRKDPIDLWPTKETDDEGSTDGD